MQFQQFPSPQATAGAKTGKMNVYDSFPELFSAFLIESFFCAVEWKIEKKFFSSPAPFSLSLSNRNSGKPHVPLDGSPSFSHPPPFHDLQSLSSG
jgi:hypothetical protein